MPEERTVGCETVPTTERERPGPPKPPNPTCPECGGGYVDGMGVGCTIVHRAGCASRRSEDAPPQTWAVIDPYEGPPRTFATEADAIKHANGVIESMCDDESWDENVQDVAVVRIHHVTIEKVLGVRAEMTPEAWERLTGGSEERDRWLDYILMPAEHSGSSARRSN